MQSRSPAKQRRLVSLCNALAPPVRDVSSSSAISSSTPVGTHIEHFQQNPIEGKQAVDAANVRVTLVDDATGDHLSWATIIDQQLRFGESTFLCGGIGGVATPEEHRRKGYSTTVMRRHQWVVSRQNLP